MQIVTKDSNYNAVLKINLSIDEWVGEETEVLVDILVNDTKAIEGYTVTATQSNVRPWPAIPAEDRSEVVSVFMYLDTQDIALPDVVVDGVSYTNLIKTSISETNYPMTVKVAPTHPGHNAMISGLYMTEIDNISGLANGEPASVTNESVRQFQNVIADGFVWDTVVAPNFWEYTINK